MFFAKSNSLAGTLQLISSKKSVYATVLIALFSSADSFPVFFECITFPIIPIDICAPKI